MCMYVRVYALCVYAYESFLLASPCLIVMSRHFSRYVGLTTLHMHVGRLSGPMMMQKRNDEFPADKVIFDYLLRFTGRLGLRTVRNQHNGSLTTTPVTQRVHRMCLLPPL